MNRHVVAGLIGLALAGCAQSRSAVNNPAGSGPGVGPVGLSTAPSIHEAVVRDNANVDPATLPSNVIARMNRPNANTPSIPVPQPNQEAQAAPYARTAQGEQPATPAVESAPAEAAPEVAVAPGSTEAPSAAPEGSAEAAASPTPEPAAAASEPAPAGSPVAEEPTPTPAGNEPASGAPTDTLADPAAGSPKEADVTPGTAGEAAPNAGGAEPTPEMPQEAAPATAAPAAAPTEGAPAEPAAPAVEQPPTPTAPTEGAAAEPAAPAVEQPPALAVPGEATPAESAAPAVEQPPTTPAATESAPVEPAASAVEQPSTLPAPAGAASAESSAPAVEQPPTLPDAVPPLGEKGEAALSEPLQPTAPSADGKLPSEPSPIELPPAGAAAPSADASLPGIAEPSATPASAPGELPAETANPPGSAPAPADAGDLSLPELPPLPAPEAEPADSAPPKAGSPAASAPNASAAKAGTLPSTSQPAAKAATPRSVSTPSPSPNSNSAGSTNKSANAGTPTGVPLSSRPLLDENVQTTSANSTMVRSELSAPGTLQAGQVAARIGEEVITLNELKVGVQQKLKRYPGQHPNREQLNMIATAVLAEMIEESMLYQKAKRELKDPKQMQLLLGFADKTWNEEEVEPMLKKTASANIYELKKKLVDRGESLDQLQEKYRRGFIAKIFMQNKLMSKLAVSLPEMLEYYNKHLKDFDRPALVKWREIVLEFSKTGGRDEAFKKAGVILTRLKQGESFAKVAQAASHGPNRQAGGLWETSPGGYALVSVNAALDRLPIGQISNIIEAPESLHIVVVESRRGAGPASFAEAEVQNAVKEAVHREKYQRFTAVFLEKIRGETHVWTMFDGTESDPRLVLERMAKQ